MSAIADAPAPERAGLFRRVFGALWSLIVGTLLCLSPVTSIIALGWISERMRARVLAGWNRPVSGPGWLLGHRGGGWIFSVFGGVAVNIREGLRALVALSVITLPFTAVWAMSWWAGWNNSFNKGYEQAFVGPLLGLSSVAVSLPILALLPTALSHFAVERRIGAIVELKRIRGAYRASGWATVWLAVATAIFVGPLFLSRVLPVFIEGIVPEFADMAAEQQADVADAIAILTAAWTFAGLWWLRGRAAAIYGRAAPVAAATDPDVWSGTLAATVPANSRRRSWLGTTLRTIVVLAASAVIPVSIYVGQFMNHSWAAWAAHPTFLLPWMP